MIPSEASPTAEVVSSARIGLARGLAWLCALIALVPLFGLIDLGTVFGLSDPQYLWSMSLEASWGSLFTFIVGGSFGWIGALPGKPWPGLLLLGLVILGLLVASAVFADEGPLWVAGGLAVAMLTMYLLLRPRGPFVAAAWPRSAASVAIACGLPLWLGYAWNTYLAAAAVSHSPEDGTLNIDHWPVQAALGLTLAFGSAVLSVWTRELVLWRWTFALTAVFVAYATLAYPDREGAMPHVLWGLCIAVWGVLVVSLPPWPGRSPSA